MRKLKQKCGGEMFEKIKATKGNFVLKKRERDEKTT